MRVNVPPADGATKFPMTILSITILYALLSESFTLRLPPKASQPNPADDSSTKVTATFRLPSQTVTKPSSGPNLEEMEQPQDDLAEIARLRRKKRIVTIVPNHLKSNRVKRPRPNEWDGDQSHTDNY